MERHEVRVIYAQIDSPGTRRIRGEEDMSQMAHCSQGRLSGRLRLLDQLMLPPVLRSLTSSS